MQAVTITQITPPELEILIENSLRKILNNQQSQSESEPEILLTVQDAAKFLSLSVPTIYGLISKKELPVMKRSKRYYFSKAELINYLKQGRKKTQSETNTEAEKFINAIIRISIVVWQVSKWLIS